jgi:hypothetical protein
VPRYKVQHRYSSGTYGPWEEGSEVTLDSVEDAEHVNRDSPGTLVEIDPQQAAAAKRARYEKEQAEREEAARAKAEAAKEEGKTETGKARGGSGRGR